MTLARLLAAVMVLCCLPAFSQDQPKNGLAKTSPPPAALLALDSNQRAALASPEPWRIIPKQPPDADSMQAFVPFGQYKADDYRVDESASIFLPNQFLAVGDAKEALNEALNNDLTCYSIRSYVVARDNKDSDSTHPVGSSTCQKASRYHVKNAEIRVGPANQ